MTKNLVLLLVFLSLHSYAKTKKDQLDKAEPGEIITETSEGRIIREDGKNVLYKKKTIVDFDDALIEGEIKNPSEFYFVHRPQEKFGSLVKKRPNFHKQMLRDTVMIK